MGSPANKDYTDLRVDVGVLNAGQLETNRRLQNIETILSTMNYVNVTDFNTQMAKKVDQVEWNTYKKAIWGLLAFALSILAYVIQNGLK